VRECIIHHLGPVWAIDTAAARWLHTPRRSLRQPTVRVTLTHRVGEIARDAQAPNDST